MPEEIKQEGGAGSVATTEGAASTAASGAPTGGSEGVTSTPAVSASPAVKTYEVEYRNVQNAMWEARNELKRAREERLKLLQELEGYRKPKDAAPKGPSLEEDAPGAIMHELAQVNSRFEALEKARADEAKTAQERQEQQQYHQQVTSYSDSMEQEFVKTHPDYFDALAFAVQKRKNFYRIRRVPEHELDARVGEEVMNLLMEEHERMGNPADVIYNLALDWGYTVKPPEGQTLEEVAATTAVLPEKQPLVRDPATGKFVSAGSAQLDTLAKGKAAATNPKSAPGTKPLTLEQLNAMSDSDRMNLSVAERRELRRKALQNSGR